MIKNHFLKNNLCLSVFLSVLICVLYIAKTEAAELFFDAPNKEFGINQQFQVDLMLDTEGEVINAIEGEITFPKELLKIKEIRDGDSIISFWVDRPREIEGDVVFSGIVPGGFEGVLSPYYEGYAPGKIFSLIFVSKEEGEGSVNFENGKVLLHDGLGTAVEFSIFNFQFSIKEDMEATPIERVPDTASPEPFFPEIAKEPSIFDGKWFLVFAAQDKGSGIDYYAIYETRRKKVATRINAKEWTEAESPYVLKDQKLRSYIYVKAVDKAGNEQIAVLQPKYPLKWYENWWVWGIIILGITISWLIWQKIKSKIKNPAPTSGAGWGQKSK